MIQRIQSVYLLLSAVGLSTLFGFPFFSAESTTDGIFKDGVLNLNDHTLLLVLAIVAIALSVVAIFLFSNRVLQMNIGRLAMLSILGLLGMTTYLVATAGVSMSVGLGIFMPVLALILLFMANKAINADEKLVRSADRLR